MNEEDGESHWTDSARMILNGIIEAVLHTDKGYTQARAWFRAWSLSARP